MTTRRPSTNPRSRSPSPSPSRSQKHIEDDHQEALVKWASLKTIPTIGGLKVIDFLYSIPNGGKRNKAEGARLKRQGVKAGVSDLHFPLPLYGKAGLWVEMKRPKVPGETVPSTSPKQKEWLALMASVGHVTAVCYGWPEARTIIENYLEGKA